MNRFRRYCARDGCRALLSGLRLALLLTVAPHALGVMNNPSGGQVDALSMSIDSAAPELTNPAGATVSLAGTDQGSIDQANANNALLFLGLFDPPLHATPTPTPGPTPEPVTELQEDWNSGSINGLIWKTHIQSSSGGARLGLDNLGGGDYALYFQGPRESGSDHTTWIYSLNNFPRGRNLRVTFTTWCDPSDTYDWTDGQPVYASPHGPWHTDNTSAIYGNSEAMIRWWNTRYFAQTGDRWPDGGVALPDFDTAFQGTTAKANALKVRVWLGDARGAKMEWATASGNWTTVVDNRGVGGGSGSPYLGFGTYATKVCIDDIIVERDGEPKANTDHWTHYR